MWRSPFKILIIQINQMLFDNCTTTTLILKHFSWDNLFQNLLLVLSFPTKTFVVFFLSNGHSPANLANSSTHRKFAVFGECEYSPDSLTFAKPLTEYSPDLLTFAKGHFWEKCDSPRQIRTSNRRVSRIWREWPLLSFSKTAIPYFEWSFYWRSFKKF